MKFTKLCGNQLNSFFEKKGYMDEGKGGKNRWLYLSPLEDGFFKGISILMEYSRWTYHLHPALVIYHDEIGGIISEGYDLLKLPEFVGNEFDRITASMIILASLNSIIIDYTDRRETFKDYEFASEGKCMDACSRLREDFDSISDEFFQYVDTREKLIDVYINGGKFGLSKNPLKLMAIYLHFEEYDKLEAVINTLKNENEFFYNRPETQLIIQKLKDKKA